MRSCTGIKGMVTVTVYDGSGNVKDRKKSFLQKLFHLKALKMKSRHHNTLTNTGAALVADIMCASPVLTKVDGDHGYIQIGNGWTGNSPKSNTRCNTPEGIAKVLDGYPVKEADFGYSKDNYIKYKALFAVGSLNASNLNEVALLNGSSEDAICLAYAQIASPVTVTEADSLTVEWEIYFRGF